MKKITILLFTAAALASGCKKFTNINTDPNNPTIVTPNVVLSAALNASATTIGTDFDNTNEWMGYWSRSGSYIAVQATEQYQLTTLYEDGDFQNLYVTMSKYNYIAQAAVSAPLSLAFYAGVAKTMEALHFANLVDGFGNVPFSQAFNITKYPTPKYDDAQTIYNTEIMALDSAVSNFTAAATYYSTALPSAVSTDDQYDIMFGRGLGTPYATRLNKWIAFANTVKLKLLMTESEVQSASYINGEIAKITANGQGFVPVGGSAAVNPGYNTGTQAKVNPFYGSFYTNTGSPQQNLNFYRANTYAVNFYSATGDSFRLPLVYAPVNGAIGSNYDGDPASLSNAFTSTIGSGLLQAPTQDQLILSDFESLFLQAEAEARGYIPGGTSGAEALVQQAIEQNFVYLGENTADADAYFQGNSTNPDVDVLAAAAALPSASANPFADQTPGMEAIITQKWIALNGINWFTAYTDYRRTGFPLADVLGISHANAHVKPAIPYRFLYPLSEFETNGKNVPTLAAAQYTPIFWDKKHQ